MTPPDAPTSEIVLDISRLLSRIRHTTPTGVDKVEMAYARGLLATVPDRLSFAAVHPLGGYGRIPTHAVHGFLNATTAMWEERAGGRAARLTDIARTLWAMRPRNVPPSGRPRTLIQASPHHLDDEARVNAILKRENARFIVLLHDLIPIEYPEYARPGGDATHRRRMGTVSRLADAVIANSAATAASFTAFRENARKPISLSVAHLGLDRHPAPITREPSRPTFVCLGTIEARKNHLLLLNIWRELAATLPRDLVPKLILIGRRGWENEQVIDMLERCPGLRHCVEERGRLDNQQVRAVLQSATAMLMPSFAEGFGMPVPEALADGVPVLCSDLPALREAGGTAPEYLDPLDGTGWMRAILDYASRNSPRRAAQIDRLSTWKAPSWDDHIATVLAQVAVLDGATSCAS